MPWLGMIGAAVMTYFGASAATVAAYGAATYVIGGIIVGAVVGGIYAGVTGGNIAKGVLYGAVGGAVVGAGGYLLYGAAAAGGVSAPAGVAAGGYGTSAPTGAAASQQLAFGAGAESTNAAAAAFGTKEALNAVSATSTLGSAFLKGGADIDPDARLAENEKDRALQRELAEKQIAGASAATDKNIAATMERARLASEDTRIGIESREGIASSELQFGKEKFEKEFSELKYQDRKDREEEETARLRFEKGIKEGSKFVTKQSQSVSLVKSNRTRRKLPQPSWQGAAQPTAPVQPGILNTGGV